jgi:hypothetical protein
MRAYTAMLAVAIPADLTSADIEIDEEDDF